MIKRRGLVLVALSLMLGTVAAMGASNWLDNRLNVGGDTIDTLPVIAAALPIPYGTKVAARHLQVRQFPTDMVPENAYSEVELVEGQVARVAIEPGEVLLKSKLAQHELGSTLAALVESNMRAVTVRVNDVIGVAGFLLPGNKVDVIGIRGGRNTKATTDTILHNIKVLAVDQSTAIEENAPLIVRAVTLELNPDQALILVKAKAEGEIQLTLRNPLDEQVAVVEEIPEAPVVKKVVRAPQVATSTTIQVIRGTRVDKHKTKI